MKDPELLELQLCLDAYVTAEGAEGRVKVRQEFPRLLRNALEGVRNDPRRAALLFKFLQVNIKMNYAGGIGKDMNNPVIKAIDRANNRLAKLYPHLYQ